MPGRAPKYQTLNDLAHYRKLPGFYRKMDYIETKRDNTGKLVISRRYSSQSYYNPNLPINDPNRIISATTYKRASRGTTPEVRQRIIEQAEREAQREETRKHELQTQAKVQVLRPVEQRLNYRQLQELQLQRRMFNYELAGHLPFEDESRQIRRAGGPLARILEAMGLRPKNAPWMVGDSGSDSIAYNAQYSVAGAFTYWKANGMMPP